MWPADMSGSTFGMARQLFVRALLDTIQCAGVNLFMASSLSAASGPRSTGSAQAIVTGPPGRSSRCPTGHFGTRFNRFQPTHDIIDSTRLGSPLMRQTNDPTRRALRFRIRPPEVFRIQGSIRFLIHHCCMLSVDCCHVLTSECGSSWSISSNCLEHSDHRVPERARGRSGSGACRPGPDAMALSRSERGALVNQGALAPMR